MGGSGRVSLGAFLLVFSSACATAGGTARMEGFTRGMRTWPHSRVWNVAPDASRGELLGRAHRGPRQRLQDGHRHGWPYLRFHPTSDRACGAGVRSARLGPTNRLAGSLGEQPALAGRAPAGE